jgi:RNA polymerase sigma-70 factor, ECF subfamily
VTESEGNRLLADWRRSSARERKELFRAIFARYFPPVLGFFLRRGVPRDSAEDLAQEVFFRVYRHLEEFRGDAHFETWLFQIAANQLRNALRERSAQKRDAEEFSLESFEAPEWEATYPETTVTRETPVDALLEEERRELLARAIQGLPVQMRRCVMLRIGMDLKYREIAELMQISIEAVKAHLFQARQRLKAELGSYFTDVNL